MNGINENDSQQRSTQFRPTRPVFSAGESNRRMPVLPSAKAAGRLSGNNRASVPKPASRNADGQGAEPPTFEAMVNADLRDRYAAGPFYEVLRRNENRVRWLRALIEIRDSLNAQNAHDNSALKSHPDRPDGGPTPASYLEAKQHFAERRRGRDKVMQLVIARIGEVRDLIGSSELAAGSRSAVVEVLAEIDSMLVHESVDEARGKLAWLMEQLGADRG
ncbi:hypothetical protein ACWIGI_28570 [Nocardia sp. NPDC055321]